MICRYIFTKYPFQNPDASQFDTSPCKDLLGFILRNFSRSKILVSLSFWQCTWIHSSSLSNIKTYVFHKSLRVNAFPVIISYSSADAKSNTFFFFDPWTKLNFKLELASTLSSIIKTKRELFRRLTQHFCQLYAKSIVISLYYSQLLLTFYEIQMYNWMNCIL